MSKRLYVVDGQVLSPIEKWSLSFICLTLKRAYSLPASDHWAVISLIMKRKKQAVETPNCDETSRPHRFYEQ